MNEKYDVKVYKTLVNKAKVAAESAYAPYSSFRVGAAVYSDTGKIYTGCNVENAAYPSGICGEDVAIFKAISEGEKKIDVIAVACIDAKSDNAIFPCGLSRQRMSEFGVEEVIIANPDGTYKIYNFEDVLPFSFEF